MNPALLRLALSILVGIAMAVIGGSIGAGVTAWLAGLPVIGLVTGALAFGLVFFIGGGMVTYRALR